MRVSSMIGVRARLLRLACIALFLAMACPGFAQAGDDPVAEFYRGKTLSLIVGYEAGSGYTILARQIARYLPAHLPGNPTIIVQNMPGAGSNKAAGYLYNAAPRDGSVIGLIGRAVALEALLEPERANFDGLRINWLGSASRNTMVGVSWHTAPVKTLEDARTEPLIVAAPSVSSEAYQIPVLYNATLGTKFKVVTGYPQPQIAQAMEQGGVQGLMQWSLDALLAQHPDWVRSKTINLLAQTGFARDSRLPGVPLAIDYARTPADKELLDLVFTTYEMARPFIAPPGVPAERLAALRTGLAQIFVDPDFLEAAAQAKIDVVNPMSGDQVRALVEKLHHFDGAVIERAKRLFAAH